MKCRMKRAINFVIVCCLIIGIVPSLGVTAQATTTVPNGYVGVYTANDLDAVRNDLDGKYILMNDIDLSAYGDWTPIGEGSSSFSGVFDGNGYSIKNMRITDDTVNENAGLFAALENATVKNIKLLSGSITCTDTPVLRAGAIAGSSYGKDTVEACICQVSISYQNGNPDGTAVQSAMGIDFSAGGIIGMVHHSAAGHLDGEKGLVIERCGNYGQISGVSGSAPMQIGGIIGNSFYAGVERIEDCFNIAALSAKTDYTGVRIGGILGQSLSTASDGSRNIVNCYNIGSLTGECPNLKNGNSSLYVGGVIGWASNDKRTSISNCYYSDNASQMLAVAKLWDKVYLSINATGTSQAAMQDQSTYKGFDFSNTWKMRTGSVSYPVLRWTLGGSPSCTHKYSSAGGNICTLCGYEFEPEFIEHNKTLYAAIENAAVRNQPYAKAGTLVDKLAKGEAVRVTHYFYNSLGSKWYRTEEGNYIYSERLTDVNSGAKTYTLSFKANGSGVSNLPSSVNIREGVRYAIPGAVSGKPQRSGYNFIGYSTNKNARTAEYVPGKSIVLTSDLTLYAVWEKKTITYSADIEDLVFSIINGGNADSKLGDTGQKYWSWYYRKPSSRSDAWCAVYTSWLLEQAGQSSMRTASPNEQVRKLTEAGCYHTKNYTPKTGDLVFFSKYGNNADHVGMIVIQDGSIYILHGNHSRKVCKSAMTDVWTNEPHRLFGDYIMGYGDMESYAEVMAN